MEFFSGPNVFTVNETIAKYAIMDGAPVGGESIPIRVCLSGYGLTPTMRDIPKKFLVRYFLNLVLVDEEEIFQATGSVQILIFHSVFYFICSFETKKTDFCLQWLWGKSQTSQLFLSTFKFDIYIRESFIYLFFQKSFVFGKKVLYFCTCLVSTLMQCFANFFTLLCVKIMLH